MKIGFTGTHGTGKTTAAYELATALKKHGYDVSVISGIARSCPLVINEKATINAQLWILGELLKKEQESKSQITICDRTLLDVWAYTYLKSNTVGEELRPFVFNYMYTYDLVFYMDMNSLYFVDDGRRSMNVAFQKEIKRILDIAIREYPIEVENGKNREEILLRKLK